MALGGDAARGRHLARPQYRLCARRSRPEETKLADRRRILAANPASWRPWEVLRKRRDAVPESSFRRFFMNQHAAIGESSWLPAGAWAKCRADYAIEDGERVFVGIDIGGTRAATALVYVTEDLRVGVQTWEGEEAVIYAEAALRELAERYVIAECAFDPWRFGAQALDLQSAGLRMVQFPQTDSPTRASRRAALGGDPGAAAASPRRSRPRCPRRRRGREADSARSSDRPCRGPALLQPDRRGDRAGDGRRPGRESAGTGADARMALGSAPVSAAGA